MSPAEGKKLPRICLLIGNFYPVVGGGERHAHLLGRELTRLGAATLVVTRRRDREMKLFETIDGINIYRVGPAGFPRAGKYMMLLPSIFQMWRLRRDYDVIYVCALRVLGLAGLIASRLTGKPCILRAEARGEMNGEFIWKSPEGRINEKKKRIYQPLIKLRNKLFLRADLFLSISTPISEEFLSTGVPENKLAVIPNGFDSVMFRPASRDERIELRKKLNLPDGILFAYSGKLIRGKGLELLLRVWRRFAASHPDAHLVLIGSGGGQYLSCEYELSEYVRDNHLEKSVTFTGYVNAVSDYLNAVDAFIFPSESESMGLAVMEALACRLPVIASRIPGIMDMVEDGVSGRLVDVKDENAWLDAMEEFMAGDVDNRQMADRGYAAVKNRFEIAVMAEQHVKLFQKLI